MSKTLDPTSLLPPDPDSPLETPGHIGIIGGGILGIEAALYGRYLGYKVSVFESESVGHAAVSRGEAQLPMLPDRSFSPLAASALAAQSSDRPETLPTTHEAWARQILVPLTQTDLLRDAVHENSHLRQIGLTAPVIDEESGQPLPPDFELGFEPERESVSVEALMIAISDDTAVSSIEVTFDLPADYLFRISHGSTGDAEVDFAMGLKRIVSIYANLAGRADLDLYAPRRG